ncbi:PH domain-containing protein [Ulvibacterium sp.]|uniref:PH domain-containing protein n=1 Tax=Ulvibacterium sp. TaxID=2665914 RepID=UPI00260BBDD2|nr:PH domain-containing protein [Ulvibacterium sp.]
MPNTIPTVKEATFNPKIKTYVLLTVAFFLTISVVGIPLLLPWFLGLGQVMSNRYYQNLKCFLTQKHLEFKKGVLFKVEKTIPLENIQDLTFIENPLLKYLDLRILKIETAGNSNPKGSDMKLIGIVDSSSFKKQVLHQRQLLVNENKGTVHREGEDTQKETLKVLKEIREILNDIRKDSTL